MAEVSQIEKRLLKVGFYVPLPVNHIILFTPAENDVLNIIRHCHNLGENAISISLFCVLTGRTDRCIRDAIKSLNELKIVTTQNVCKSGTFYTINNKVLLGVLGKLNNEPSPVQRLKIVDKFRGPSKALHTKTIEKYQNTSFNRKIKTPNNE